MNTDFQILKPLSPRESQVAQLLSGGDSKKMVAGKLNISPRTVENITRTTYAKLQINSVGQLCRWVYNNIPSPARVLGALFLLGLTIVNELNDNSDMFRRTRSRVKTVNVKTKIDG